MEIREIISFYINYENEVLEVDFRTTDDTDSEVRTAEINLSELEEFGLEINHNLFDGFEEIEDDFEDMGGLDEEFNLQEDLSSDDILSFLNEYYNINPAKLPESGLF